MPAAPNAVFGLDFHPTASLFDEMARKKLTLSKERRQLVCELFVLATVLSEKANDLSFVGHARDAKPERYMHVARGLRVLAEDLAAVTGAITAAVARGK